MEMIMTAGMINADEAPKQFNKIMLCLESFRISVTESLKKS
jgi:hypothetical protein